MTTAGRPTFEPARGGRGKGENDLSAMSKQYSSRDLPAHTRLKTRQEGQGTQEELRSKDHRRSLEERERSVRRERERGRHGHSSSASDVIGHGSSSTSSISSLSSKKPRLDQIPASNLDADDPLDEDDDDEDSDDSDDDDTAELMAELQKIKKERAQERLQKEAEVQAEQERIRTENILSGNPLLGQQAGNFKVKRRWDDDVVFKNCARIEEDKPQDPSFVNDSIRNEFHKRFMNKYIQ